MTSDFCDRNLSGYLEPLGPDAKVTPVARVEPRSLKWLSAHPATGLVTLDRERKGSFQVADKLICVAVRGANTRYISAGLASTKINWTCWQGVVEWRVSDLSVSY